MSEPRQTDPLKPCPFCGGEARFDKIHYDYNRDFGGEYITCGDCEVSTGLRFACGNEVKPLLAETWNRRADPPPGYKWIEEEVDAE